MQESLSWHDLSVAGANASLAPRADFPLLKEIAYLNSAAIGLVAPPTQACIADFLQSIGHGGSTAYFDRYRQIMHEPREAGARLLGGRPEQVAIVTSISEAISQIAWWRRPRSDENVVLIDIDAPSVNYPWLRVARETGCEIRFVRAAEDPAGLGIEQVERLVDARTAVIALSHVQWTTGHRFDLDELVALARSNGALLVVDAMHSAGVMPLDAVASGVDVLVTGAFKWLCGFSGVGACYVRPELLDAIEPILVGSRSTDMAPPFSDSDATRLSYPADARRLEYGSSIHGPRVAFTAAVDYLAACGFDNVLRHVQALSAHLARELLQLGAEILTPAADSRRAGILSARFPGVDAAKLTAALDAQRVAVSPRQSALRFSPHVFNDTSDIDRAVFQLRRILQTQ